MAIPLSPVFLLDASVGAWVKDSLTFTAKKPIGNGNSGRVLYVLGVAFSAAAALVRVTVANAELVRRGGEFQLNSVAEGGEHSPSIAALPDGGFIAAWERDPDVLARRFDADAQPLGTEFLVNTTQPGGAPNIAVAPDGSFLMVWQSGSDIVGQRFDAAGVQQGSEFTLTDLGETGQQPSAAAIGDSQFVAVWENFNTCEIRGRLVGPIAQGEAFSVPDGGQEETLGNVAGDAAASYQIVWYNAYDLEMRAQQFKGAVPATAPFAVASVADQGSVVPGPTVCSREGAGSFVVAWSALIDEVDDQKIRYREVGPSGSILDPVVDVTPEVSTESAPLQLYPNIACGSSGSLVVTWYDLTEAIEDRGRVFRNGAFSDFTIGFINPAAASSTASPALLKGGDAVVVWSDCATGMFTDCRILGQQFTQSAPIDCPGDCDRDRRVTIDELITAINIALTGDPSLMKACLPADTNLDYTVSIGELLAAVNSALHGCK